MYAGASFQDYTELTTHTHTTIQPVFLAGHIRKGSKPHSQRIKATFAKDQSHFRKEAKYQFHIHTRSMSHSHNINATFTQRSHECQIITYLSLRTCVSRWSAERVTRDNAQLCRRRRVVRSAARWRHTSQRGRDDGRLV